MRQPLLVHLVFHPASPVEPGSARDLALKLHAGLSGDPAVPGLRVPTVFAADDGTNLPPANHRLDETDRSFVVVLIDDAMVNDARDVAGRPTWPAFVQSLWQRCQNSSHRCLPVAVSPHAHPLDPRLAGVNFVRADLSAADARVGWVWRRTLVELCRFLDRRDVGDQLPLRLFLSHAKQDINAEPQVFRAMIAHLEQTQPVKTWIDSADIEGGSQFAERIEQGVKDSLFMVLATRTYASRPWCRRELLIAKREDRPFVVVDALEGLDPRSFPYSGNAPVLRWTADGAAAAVDLLLKETLRHAHVRALLDAQKRADDVVLATSPELTTVVRLAPGSSVLYPDPPVGDEESDAMEPLGHRLATPLQRAADGQTLKRVPIALSISESADLARVGLAPEHLYAALIEISRQLLVRGAILEYGGHLGPDGYTVALFDMARAYAAMSGLPPAELVVIDVGWPMPLETLPAAQRAANRYVARFDRSPRPAGVETLEPATFVEEPTLFPADSPERRYAWARGMTAMREVQASKARARVVLGGKIGPTETATGLRWYLGRIPGVVEEALVSLRAGQPLYLIGGFGGAAGLTIDLLEGRPRSEFTWDYQKAAPHAEAMRAIYESQGPGWEDYDAMSSFFAATGVDGLASANRLTAAENRELFESRDLLRIVELVLQGLARANRAD